APIQAIFCNGRVALRYYHKFQEPKTHTPAQLLPPTTSAKASYSPEDLIEIWKEKILKSETKEVRGKDKL
ncbi:MAG: hypothetical protein K2H85_11995, partial [Allobaculum sp.]|nr:hypothetical protein [Allobaculum sp.]